MSETYEETLGDNCKHCLAPIAVRNPTGTCDHLCWPDYLTPEAKLANGIPLSEIERLRSLLEDLVRATEVFAKGAQSIPETWPDDAEFEGEILVGDLRRAREAYLKAKGV